MDLNNLPEGLYEQLLTQMMANQLDEISQHIEKEELSENDAALYISTFIKKVTELALNSLPKNDRVQQQVAIANAIIELLAEKLTNQDLLSENQLHQEAKIITAIFNKTNPVATDLQKHSKHIRPATGVAQSELFCGSKAGISLESELKKEILSADEICWIVAFIKWTGLRIFQNELEEFSKQGKKIRIITTSYMGATDQKAVEWLATLPNTEIKINYNSDRERLHAKSYIFRRKSGFHTAYIGSSNLSHSALTHGLEWNVKITSQEIPHIIEKTQSVFDALWHSDEFENYQPNVIEHKDKLAKALKLGRDHTNGSSMHFFNIRPFDHQQEILEKLQAERINHQRNKNLVVAATGTGKTLISAFDFANFVKENPSAKILFVAHREEILKQALNAYRNVLRRESFGELWFNGNTPNSYREVFATIQTLNSQLSNINLSSDYYDYIVIDEVHHIAANSYRSVINHFNPRILLGLTATPERQDGESILQDFCGVIAAEIRLPEAINRGLLSPFHYFGIDDDTDLSKVSWRNGRYVIDELSNLYTASDIRTQKIINNLINLSTDVNKVKALAFCISKQHAEYMSQKLNNRGIKADVLTSDNSQFRQEKLQNLRSGNTNVLCVVDMFNEGVDIPEVDTILFLRPTESLTIFLQQLGRGLRFAEGKVCTILDFVGNSRPEYSHAQKFRALIGKTKNSTASEIEDDFQHLPLGCRIELTRQAKELILKNIKQATINAKNICARINDHKNNSTLDLNLYNFIQNNPEVALTDIYNKSVKSWSRQLLKLELNKANISENELAAFELGMRTRITQCDDRDYLSFLNKLARNRFQVTPQHDNYALLAHYDFWQKSCVELGFSSAADGLKNLYTQDIADELEANTRLLLEAPSHQHYPMPISTAIPMKVHARYSREQILVCFGVNTHEKQTAFREGVLDIKDKKVFVLFVTLDKSEKHFSPSTMYKDYALSPTLFQWQPQNATRPDKGRGSTLINHQDNGYRIFLFVRETAKDAYERTTSYVNFGEVFYHSHSYEHGVMGITWKLRQALPMFMWEHAAKLSAA